MGDEVIARFVASIPQIQSAFSVGGDGSVRLKLDIPESELAEMVKLIGYGREKALIITVAGESCE